MLPRQQCAGRALRHANGSRRIEALVPRATAKPLHSGDDRAKELPKPSTTFLDPVSVHHDIGGAHVGLLEAAVLGAHVFSSSSSGSGRGGAHLDSAPLPEPGSAEARLEVVPVAPLPEIAAWVRPGSGGGAGGPLGGGASADDEGAAAGVASSSAVCIGATATTTTTSSSSYSSYSGASSIDALGSSPAAAAAASSVSPLVEGLDVPLAPPRPPRRPRRRRRDAARASAGDGTTNGIVNGALYPPSERTHIQDSWDALMRWSKFFRRQQEGAGAAGDPADAPRKVVVFGGGSFGTAMGCSLARKRPELDVVLLLRDPALCADINGSHCNTKYLPDFKLPPNMRATTDIHEAAAASYAVHAVPVQHSRAFLKGIKDVLPPHVPIVCVSKGLEVGTGCMMSEVIPSALGRRQPATFISGPSFAREVMEGRPTGVVAASRDAHLARDVQQLFASPSMRVNTSTDVIGVEICGALKNVLAIAAGIVEGLDLGHNALAALVAQGCAEIRWLAEKLGAKPQTMSGLSGLGDIMLTCYGDLSRNRRVGMRLGKGERLEDIIASSSQVAEGVATAGVVVSLARRYRVSLPVLTAVAQVLDSNITPAEAVAEIMSLPQIEER